MRQRNLNGSTGTRNSRAGNRPNQVRRPVTERGRLALESSRRRFVPRADS
jgi:hypothetical protein